MVRRSSHGDAVADISAFHGGPSQRLRSLLDDGTLTETVPVGTASSRPFTP